MDQVKMAEGRRRAAEQRQADDQEWLVAQEAIRVEKEKRKRERQEEWEKKQLDHAVIRDFSQLEVQMKTFYEELSILSKKSPDGPLNRFKLKLVNDTLKRVNAIIGDTHRPFPDFELFSESDLPSSSDAVLMLSHYLKSMMRFEVDHSYWGKGAYSNQHYWCIKGDAIPDDDE